MKTKMRSKKNSQSLFVIAKKNRFTKNTETEFNMVETENENKQCLSMKLMFIL